METTAVFTAGAVLGIVISVLPVRSSAPPDPAPPPPPPMPVEKKRPKTRIFYRMKQICLPLAPNGEDMRRRITLDAISSVVLKKAPPQRTIEEKRAEFFRPQSALHCELLRRVKSTK